MPAAGSLKRLIMRLQLSGALPDQDYVLNHVVNRMPLVEPRMRAYAALGVQFDDLDSANISLGVEMWAGHNLSMGRGSTIGQRCYIDARGGIRVEPEVSISREVLGVNSRIYGTTGRRQRSLVVVGFRWCLVPA